MSVAPSSSSSSSSVADSSFDQLAQSYDQKDGVLDASRQAFRALSEWLPRKLDKSVNALEVGCGTGNVTLLVAPLVGSVVGIDTSSGMLAELNSKLEKINADRAQQPIANLSTRLLELKSPADLDNQHFDLIYSVMTFHHIPDIPSMLRTLFELLRSGGHLVIIDLLKENHTTSFHPLERHPSVTHHGFSQEEIARDLAAAGFELAVFRTDLVINHRVEPGQHHHQHGHGHEHGQDYQHEPAHASPTDAQPPQAETLGGRLKRFQQFFCVARRPQ